MLGSPLKSFRWFFVQLFFFVLTQPVVESAPVDDLVIYTENSAPFNYLVDGQPSGASVEILMEVFARLKIAKGREDIIFAPWTRGMSETQRRKNTMLFSVARLPSREKMFLWVGPVNAVEGVIVSRKETNLSAENYNVPGKFKYAAQKKAAGETILLNRGVLQKDIVNVNSHISAVQMLARGRVDAWVHDLSSAFEQIRKQGLPESDYKVTRTMNAFPNYFAFNTDTDVKLINDIRRVFALMVADGTVRKLNLLHGALPWQERPETVK